jgi:hypothetical protein
MEGQVEVTYMLDLLMPLPADAAGAGGVLLAAVVLWREEAVMH